MIKAAFDYAAGCSCPLRPCPIHDTPNQDTVEEMFPDAEFVVFDGFDRALIGVTWAGGVLTVCYDQNKVYNILRARDNMTHDEALEWIDYNMVTGEDSPIMVTLI